MSKVIDSIVQNEIDGKDFVGVVLARLHWDTDTPYNGPLRLCNAYQNIYWDEAGTGEEEYIGLGHMAQLSPVPESNELAAQQLQLTLSGIPSYLITDIFAKDAYQNNPCYIWYGLLDKQTYAVQGGQNGPVLIFAGLMDYCTFEFGQQATIQLTVSSRLTDWERPRGGRYNDSHQRNYVDPTDSGFKYVVPLQSKEIRFGGASAADPGGGDWAGFGSSRSGTGGGGGGGGGGPDGCFIADTLITMADGKKLPIQDLGPGDAIRGSNGFNIVEHIHNYEYKCKLYSINGSEYFVTGCHPFQTSKGWKAFNVTEALEHNPNLNIEPLEEGNILHKDNNKAEMLNDISSIPTEGVQVYNFTVSGTQDFFANDYLVHNVEKFDLFR